MTDDPFAAWYDAVELHSLRSGRAEADTGCLSPGLLRKWMRAAWEAGRNWRSKPGGGER